MFSLPNPAHRRYNFPHDAGSPASPCLSLLPTPSRIALNLYGLEATARSLPGEYDDNFHLLASDSRALVLKLTHPSREESFVSIPSAVRSPISPNVPLI